MVSTTSDAMTFAPLDPIAAAFAVSPKAPFAAAAVIAAVADPDTNPLAAPAHAAVPMDFKCSSSISPLCDQVIDGAVDLGGNAQGGA